MHKTSSYFLQRFDRSSSGNTRLETRFTVVDLFCKACFKFCIQRLPTIQKGTQTDKKDRSYVSLVRSISCMFH